MRTGIERIKARARHEPGYREVLERVIAAAKGSVKEDLQRPFTPAELYKEAVKWREKYPFTFNEHVDNIPSKAIHGMSHFILLKTAQAVGSAPHEFDSLVKLVALEKNMRRSAFGGHGNANAARLLRENGIETNRASLSGMLAKTMTMAKFLDDTNLFTFSTVNRATHGMKHGFEAAILMQLGFSNAYDTLGAINDYVSASLRKRK